MSHGLRRLIVVLICGAVAFGVPLSRVLAGDRAAPCDMDSMQHDGGGMAAAEHDCDCGGDKAAAMCAAHCAAAFAGLAVPAHGIFVQRARGSDAVAALPAASFESHAGPPGLPPPR